MDKLVTFLNRLVPRTFQLLPMREKQLNGLENNTKEYLSNLLIAIDGGYSLYPELSGNDKYVFAQTKLHYALISFEELSLKQYRSIILESTGVMADLAKLFEGVPDEQSVG